MTRFHLHSILLLIFLISGEELWAQPADTTWNQTDALGQKQGHWKKYDPDGNMIYRGYFKDGKPVGRMERFYADGTRRAELTYPEGTDITYAKIFYRNGKLAATGKYVGMHKDSVWNYYSYYSENLTYAETYEMGMKNGVSVKYYPGGQTAEIMTWKEDMKHGPWKQFYEDSTIRLVSQHDSNQLHGDYKVFNRNQVLIMKGAYEHGKMDKTWHFYDEKGNEEHTLHYQNGELQNSKELDEWAKRHMEEIEQKLGTIPEVDINDFLENRE